MTPTEAATRAMEDLAAAHDEVDGLPDDARSAADQVRSAVAGLMDRMPNVAGAARDGVDQVAARLPNAVERARAGAVEANFTLQTLPDPTLRLMAAASIGLTVGLFLRSAPHVLTLVSVAPVLFVVGAIITRPGRIQRQST